MRRITLTGKLQLHGLALSPSTAQVSAQVGARCDAGDRSRAFSAPGDHSHSMVAGGLPLMS